MKLRVKELREQKKLSIRALAEATGLHHSIIARIEKGERKISTSQAEALASYFGVSVDYLIGGDIVEVYNQAIGSLRDLCNDGESLVGVDPSIDELLRSKIELLILVDMISSIESIKLLLELAQLRLVQDKFGGKE